MYARSSFLCRQIRFSIYHSSGNRTSSFRTKPERTAACNWLTWNRKRSYRSVMNRCVSVRWDPLARKAASIARGTSFGRMRTVVPGAISYARPSSQSSIVIACHPSSLIMALIIVRAMSACLHSSSLMLCDTPRRYCPMPTAIATRALRMAAYFPIHSSLVALGTAFSPLEVMSLWRGILDGKAHCNRQRQLHHLNSELFAVVPGLQAEQSFEVRLGACDGASSHATRLSTTSRPKSQHLRHCARRQDSVAGCRTCRTR